ncbi:hypothetical protein HDV00_000376 [Rhizophlyctis rosea]|nr:hypothetical protein HDV00_000376 [Rhizophlyctis rosea]
MTAVARARVDYFVQIIGELLEHQDTETALVLAERLAAAYPTYNEPPYLIAKAHLHAGAPHIAARALERQTSYPPSRFLYAYCCYSLERQEEARRELQILKSQADKDGRIEWEAPGGSKLKLSQICSLIGKVERRMANVQNASDSFTKALQLDPLLWSAYQNLCEMGKAAEPTDAFGAGDHSQSANAQINNLALTDMNKGKKRKRNQENENSQSTQPTEASLDQHEAQNWMKNILIPLGQAYKAQQLYASNDALAILLKIEPKQYNTAWVHAQMGRAHYELGQYAKAVDVFKKARSLQPWIVEHMDIYGSCLWHLKKEYELSALAKDMEALDRLAPQSWCVIGNLYSLKQEHQTAIRCIARAMQLNTYYDYAYTLLGHEFMAVEDLEQAEQYFMKARSRNPRSFNAWYSLGQVYFQQNKKERALLYYTQASKLNDKNPILHCYIGMLHQKEQNLEESLSSYERAVELDPTNPLYWFRKAFVLFLMEEFQASDGNSSISCTPFSPSTAQQAALECLNKIESASKYEVNVYTLQGRVHKALGNKDEAMLAFTKAQAFTKDPNVIKDAIDRLDQDEENGEDGASMF